MTHICISKLSVIGSDNGLSPGRRQAIIWTNTGILLILTLGTNFSEILIKIHTLSSEKMHLKVSSAKWQPFCLSLNMLTHCPLMMSCGAWWHQAITWTNVHFLLLKFCGPHLTWEQCHVESADGVILYNEFSHFPGASELTHWGRDKMATTFQTTFSNAFSWMKMNEFFWLKFHWSLFLRVQLAIF